MKYYKTIKFRLTITYLVGVVILLLIFNLTTYFMLSNNLYKNLDDSLRTRMVDIQFDLKTDSNGFTFDETPNELVLIYDSNGNSQLTIGPNVTYKDIEGLVSRALFGQSSFITSVVLNDQKVRLYAAPYTTNSNTRLAVVLGRLTSDVTDVLGKYMTILGISTFLIIFLAVLGGVLLANRALKPVERITTAAKKIGETDLSQRIEVDSDDELGRLATTFNTMVEKLEASFSRQQRFTADASHELRTPLSVIQAESTLAIDKERSQAEYRKSLELISHEVNYMSDIISKMLVLARSDTGKEILKLDPVNLKDFFIDLSEEVEVLASQKGLHYLQGPVENLSVFGDDVKLRELFLCILENAIKYTPTGGDITVWVIAKNNKAVITVSDTGIGIPAENLPFIFQRFYRVDRARSRAEGGAGLGLSIAKHIAEAHGGTIEVESQVNKGSTFKVLLPLIDTDWNEPEVMPG